MYIFHCVRKRDYDPTAKFYGEESVKKCGFIHCSDIDTYYLVAPNFKDDYEERILLLINTDKVIPEIKWEDSEGWDFPHIYGLLNTDAVEAILPHIWSEDRVWIPNEELAQFKKLYAYHVVTDRPMHVGQQIIFDETHHSGVYQRVYEKIDIVNDIYSNPSKYNAEALEHHTSVALRELALEEVRQKKYPQYPSRMGCLYVSNTFEEAERWGEFFSKIGRPTYHIVKLEIEGNCFVGDATKCFEGQLDKQENLRLAEVYWENKSSDSNEQPICEMLVDGHITVIEIVKEINANIG